MSHWRPCFTVESSETAVARVRELGGKQLLGPLEMPDGSIAVVLDPHSAVFALFAGTGPVAGVLGTRGTLVAAGAVGATVTCAAFFVPGMRDPERRARVAPQPVDTGRADLQFTS